MTRREYLRGAVGAAAAVGLGRLASAGASDSARRPPNILFILSDEHNARVLGCCGNAIARTPNLDALANRGVVFENAYTNSPLCVPSRLSITSGKYSSRVSVWNNDCWLPSSDYPSLPRILDDAGYETVLCGKMHYDRTQRYGFTKELQPTTLNNGTMSGTGGRRKPDDLAPTPGISDRFSQFHPGDSSSHLEHDRTLTASATKFIRERKASDKPFFFLSGYITPHFPLIVPEKYWKNFQDKVPLPTIPEGYLDTLAPNYKHERIGFNEEDVPTDVVKKGRELYYGLAQWFDEQVGELLKTLGDSEVADNTVVIYSSDHGENMGEHGLWWKNAMFEPASHVPLIVSWPARWKGGQRRSGVCSLVDVVQTIADLAGAHTPKDWNGDSLAAYLSDPSDPWKDIAVSEYYAHNIASGFVMLREGSLKYVYHTQADEKHPAQRELYDLKTDPGELTNLAERPEHKETIERLHARLIKEVGEDPEKTEQRARVDLAKGYGRKKADKNSAGAA
ncbi:MAG: sulfatase-like hydrolase/transferase [Candidatus Hydrogenedentes bacterium]|nr:sulfatase-like hydrolase/transferase [Candidatus Hydrogenedentota bacterium]